MRAKELWRVPEPFLAEAQADATLLAIKAQEDAGLDIITDGEIRRESYSNRFATALEGVDLDNPGTALDRSGHPNPVPRVTGRIRRRHAGGSGGREVPPRAHAEEDQDHRAGTVHDVAAGAERFLHVRRRELAMDYAAAVNEEIRDLFAAGADVVQIDEPVHAGAAREGAAVWAAARSIARSRASPARPACTSASATRPSSTSGRRATRSCPSCAGCSCGQVSIETAQSNLDCSVLTSLPGKQILLGVIDLSDMNVESGGDRGGADSPGAAVRRAPENIVVATDCGMKYLPREVAMARCARWSTARASCVRNSARRCKLTGWLPASAGRNEAL